MMGEYADMMLDGTCCAGCGEYLFNDDPWGIPTYCPSCQPAGGATFADGFGRSPTKTVPCPDCNRLFATTADLHRHHSGKHGAAQCSECGKHMKSAMALRDHMRRKHPVGWHPPGETP